MSKLFGKRIYKLHQWSGLLAGIVILILGLSGAILVFHDELETAEHQQFLWVENTKPTDVDRAFRQIASQYENWEIRLQEFSSDPSRTLIFSLRRPDQRLTVFVHSSSGKILEARDTYKSFVTWVLYLHYSLHARLFGQVVVLLAGIGFLISILTGLVIYRKAVLDVMLFRIKFRTKNQRSIASSLHRHVGVWALLLNLVIVSSGVLISYDIVENGIKSGKKVKQLVTPQIGFSINRALETLKQRYPDFRPSSMRFPTAPGLPLRINGGVEGQNIFWSKNYNSVLLDPQTGEVQALKLRGNADGKTKVASFSRGVHFLEFANLPVKILFCLAALSAPVLSITGFMLWFWGRKRKRKGK